MPDVAIRKGGRGPVGSAVKSEHGKYVHYRKKKVPRKKKVYWRTITRNGKKLRQYLDTETGKWITQSVLKPLAKKRG